MKEEADLRFFFDTLTLQNLTEPVGGENNEDTNIVEFDPELTEDEIEILSIQFHNLQKVYIKRVGAVSVENPVQRNLSSVIGS